MRDAGFRGNARLGVMRDLKARFSRDTGFIEDARCGIHRMRD